MYSRSSIKRFRDCLVLFAIRFQSPRRSPTVIANMLSECCDVIVAHSPPIYSGTPQVLYQNFRLVVNKKQQSPLTARRHSSRSSTPPTTEDDKQPQANHSPGAGKPRRPCLVIRADSESSIGSSSSGSSSSDENEPLSPVHRKKKVVFADDRGLSLTQVSPIYNIIIMY